MSFRPAVLFLACSGVMTMFNATAQHVRGDDPLVFISAFASGEAGAIHAFRLNMNTGQLQPLARFADVENPFFLALSPGNEFLYSIHAQRFGGPENGEIAAYRIVGTDGELQLLNRQSARGTAACYLDAVGQSVLVANYSSGSVAALPVQTDGSLGEASSFMQHQGSSVNTQRQKGPHAHCIVVSPDGRFAYAADLGLDRILCYQLDAETATLTPGRQSFVRTPPGAGPRHLTFHPNGQWMYVINELSNTITHFDYEAQTGMLIERKTISTLPEDFDGTSYCADLKITPDGRFLYGTNRGHHSLAAYRIGDDGGLTLIEIQPSLGDGPQNLTITPGGEFLLCANMPGKNVAVFRINGMSGKLSSTGDPMTMPAPSCIMLIP